MRRKVYSVHPSSTMNAILNNDDDSISFAILSFRPTQAPTPNDVKDFFLPPFCCVFKDNVFRDYHFPSLSTQRRSRSDALKAHETDSGISK